MKKPMVAHGIDIRVFATPEDELAAVEKGFLSLLPFDPTAEKLCVSRKEAVGFNERVIHVIEARLEKQRHITQFLDNLMSKLGTEQKGLLQRQIDSRLDDNMYFYIRLDKRRLIDVGKLVVTDSGECFHIKLMLSPFPRNKGKAQEIARALLQG